MKAYVIAIEGHEESQAAKERLLQSSRELGNEFEIEEFSAVTPKDLPMAQQVPWNWPIAGSEKCSVSGLTKHAYKTKVIENRIACAVSHLSLWEHCWHIREPILILEHDAIFIKQLNPQFILDSDYECVGLNNPIGATRRAALFCVGVGKESGKIVPIPVVDNDDVPQGMAGNSAYIIKPEAALKAMVTVRKVGLWPNDALLCRQLIPHMGVTRQFFTNIQKNLTSTTTC